MTDALRPMTVEEVERHSGQVVALPPFEDGTPFVARLRRGGALSMLTEKKLPNPILGRVLQAWRGQLDLTKESVDNPEEFLELINIICETCLLDPPWEKVRAYLSDPQRNAILAYFMGGVAAVASFRKRQRTDAAAGGDGKEVGNAPEPSLPGA